ncbi:uncharacterized protein PFLUO_LOCUS2067 [Penicillium psychrofluorescens]|uniref:uncharacterized protein n=1 Tax=Penicillium psychrofluorescens TaxID=3158075 RepID=UPI003CCDD5C7
MQLGLSENLSALVARRFIAAKEGGHLVFSSTHLSTINAAGISYQLRYCPALAKKPTNSAAKPSAGSNPKPPKPDPFADPSPDLLVAQFPPSRPTHALVLNKFPVIPDHFILATTEWRSQTDLLDKDDLEATYECLRAWPAQNHNPEGRLFAFFNSGDESGASQPHRHLQFLPVEAMRQQPECEGWSPLIDQFSSSPTQSHSNKSVPLTLQQFPIAAYALPIPSNPSPDTLFSIYQTLYHAAVAATQGRDAHQGPTTQPPPTGPSLISYNLAMTLSTMMICPRRHETATVPVDSDAAVDILDFGVVSLNGTILAGTLMVKAESEWDTLRENPELLTKVLEWIGFPRTDSRGSSYL